MSFNITPVASGYQEIHPYSAMNIDSVKINTSLIMMRECIIHHLQMKSALPKDLLAPHDVETVCGIESSTLARESIVACN